MLSAARDALEEVRSVVSDLHGGEEIDLRSVLGALAEKIPRVRLHLSLPDQLSMTDAARANSVLRCVQEITTNTLKHSDAANLWIVLRINGDAIEIEARDDGRNSRRSEAGFGLKTMRQRFEELGGTVSFDSSNDHGFMVRALLPSTGIGEGK